MNEDERRELIARQHRALYGENSSLYNNNPTSSQDVRVQTSGAARGASPLAFDPFGMQAQNASGEATVQMPPRGDKDVPSGAQEARANSNSSPSSAGEPDLQLFSWRLSSHSRIQQVQRVWCRAHRDAPLAGSAAARRSAPGQACKLSTALAAGLQRVQRERAAHGCYDVCFFESVFDGGRQGRRHLEQRPLEQHAQPGRSGLGLGLENGVLIWESRCTSGVFALQVSGHIASVLQ
jgi:hypothetical protein